MCQLQSTSCNKSDDGNNDDDNKSDDNDDNNDNDEEEEEKGGCVNPNRHLAIPAWHQDGNGNDDDDDDDGEYLSCMTLRCDLPTELSGCLMMTNESFL